jgi:replicative DNA helicase
MSKYIDTSAVIQVIGAIYNNPSLLDMEEKYKFCEEDFELEFHKILFGSIYNLHALGAKTIALNTIEDYLSQRPKKYAVYKANKGAEYLQKISENISSADFNYYYSRLKKMTLLRMYNNIGMDLSWLYDPDNILDVKKKQKQEEWLDNTSLEDIATKIDDKISSIKMKYADDFNGQAVQAGENCLELLESFKKNPEYGYPMFGPLINTVTRGARLKKFYLRSAPAGTGKTRMMIADACNFACDELYDSKEGKWVENGTKEPTLYITTEQEVNEIQTMMIAFISDVDEEHILTGEYYAGEWERVAKAADILKKSPIYVQELHDFSMQDIENTLKRGIFDFGVKYLVLDYIHTSMKILSEISSKSKVSGLREDNILFLIGVKLKDLANEYGVFILSSTQLNSSWKEEKVPDQNMLRGAKSLGDKIDMGAIMLKVTSEDLEFLQPILSKNTFESPDTKISIYKNRRGKYNNLFLWCKSNKGTCKIIPMFATDYNYEFIEMEDTKIKITSKIQASAF